MTNKPLITLILLLLLPQAAMATLSLTLEYGSTPGYDPDNDGIENIGNGIDFSVADSLVSDPSTICTRWLTYSIESGSSEVVCYGSVDCCSAGGLPVQETDWNQTFYLVYGDNTDSLENSILAQLMRYDPVNGLNATNWELLAATFTERRISSVEINESGTTVIIYSPDNTSAILRTHPLALNVSIDRNATLSYSLDNASGVFVQGEYDGSNSTFSSTLNGSLAYNTFINGIHTLNLTFSYENVSAEIIYTFTVNDSTPPVLTHSLNLSTSTRQKSILTNISTDEIANIAVQNAEISSWNGTAGSLNLSLNNGSNEFIISATDLNNNSINYSLFLEASITVMNCSDGVMNYHEGENETGIDCGGACPACVAFTLSTDKATYTLGELAYIHVTARNDVAHNITVKATDFYYSLTYPGSTYYIINPTKIANYSINVTLNYKGNIENQIGSFEVNSPVQSNPLSASITANETSIFVWDYIQFNASASGNTSRVSYRWDFDSDNQNESEATSIVRLYNETGSFNVTLHASDGKWNISTQKTITSKGIYAVIISVVDNATLVPIDAEITLGTVPKNTSAGSAVFEAREGSYIISLSSPDYEAFSKSITINANLTLNLSLKKKKADALLLNIISPANNTILDNTIIFTYAVEDPSPATCVMQISTDMLLWRPVQKGSAIQSGKGEFSVTLPNGTSYWIINCTDTSGRTNASEPRTAEVNANALYVDIGKEDQKATDSLAVIEASMNVLEGFDTKERELITDMQLENYLAELKKQIERSNRDLHNVKWRRLNQTEQTKLEKELVKKVEQAKNGAIKDIRIIKTTDFVNYPKEPDVALLSSTLYAKDLSKLDIAAFNEKNVKLQSYITTTTKYRTVEITYESGKKTYSVMTKKMAYSRNISEDFAMYEIIPKEFADNASRITFLFDHEVIEQDPIIKFTERENKFTYYVEGEASLTDANKAKTVILSNKEPLKKSNQLSGNAILGIPFKVTVDFRVMAEVIVIILLIIFYFAYSFLFPGVDKNLVLAQKKLTAASSSIVSGDYDSAKTIYADLAIIFAKLAPLAKKRLYPVMTELSHKIDVLFLKKKIVEANLYVESNPKQAHIIYSDVAAIYKRLPETEKKIVHPECADLNARIAKSLKNEKTSNT